MSIRCIDLPSHAHDASNRLTSLNLRDDTTQPVVSRVYREQAIVLKVQTIDSPSHLASSLSYHLLVTVTVRTVC